MCSRHGRGTMHIRQPQTSQMGSQLALQCRDAQEVDEMRMQREQQPSRRMRQRQKHRRVCHHDRRRTHHRARRHGHWPAYHRLRSVVKCWIQMIRPMNGHQACRLYSSLCVMLLCMLVFLQPLWIFCALRKVNTMHRSFMCVMRKCASC